MKNFSTQDKKKYVIVQSKKGKLTDYGRITVEPTFQFSPFPLITNYPPIVKDSSKVTLFDLDRGQYMFSSSLPSACQELYFNIKDLNLEFPENPIMKLSDAIRYSIETKGMTLYKKLQEKDPKFGYVRVTLGPESRTAPGIPYVLEIWPKGRGSPVHNHGGASAIIKVLFGRITVQIYNKLIGSENMNSEGDSLLKFDLKDNQVTWIDSNWYQTHKLHNNTDDFCATVQCYRYDMADSIQWPNFDYVAYVPEEDKYELQEFYPDSDFTFIHLRSLVLKEYSDYLSGGTDHLGQRGY